MERAMFGIESVGSDADRGVRVSCLRCVADRPVAWSREYDTGHEVADLATIITDAQLHARFTHGIDANPSEIARDRHEFDR